MALADLPQASKRSPLAGKDLGGINFAHKPALTRLYRSSLPYGTEVGRNFRELLDGGFEVFDDFLGENVGIRKIVGFFQAFVSEQDVEAGFVAVLGRDVHRL